ncbi:MAG TPA: peptidoglycan -binding protein [Kiloniellaceae bacterium]|nr:peptidoglycan -binding protein [Kiloniellaceae bacterium]
MYALGRGGSRRSINIWPGFVDGLASLLLVVIFVLMVFMVAQFFLSIALTGKDEALARLNSQINELAELLALERSSNVELQSNISELSSQLQGSLAEQESLMDQLRDLTEDRDNLAASLADAQENASEAAAALLAARQALEEEQNLTAEERRQRQEAESAIDAQRAKLDAALASMRIDKERLKEALAAIAAKEAELKAAYESIDADKERIQTQLAELAILKSLRDEMQEKLLAGEAALAQQSDLTDEAQAQVALLNRQIAALRSQLATLAEALEVAEADIKEKDVQIASLGQRLNVALASKVQELARYRSDFFGRLRETLGNRQDIRVVGDRFVFQSEVLFDSGSAELAPDGRRQLAALASALKEIAAKIPDDLAWVLRVDGHTDRNPISTAQFPSNWELSTARAISVVKFLIAQGISPDHLAATGFGEYQPLDDGSGEIADRRNRRIELKLTQR